ncbi:partial Oxygen sensor histidine kinase NreB, partial [Anaerolineae bacterium]
SEAQFYHDLIETAPFGCILTTLNGIIHEANRAAAVMLGMQQDALVSKPLVGFVSEEEGERPTFHARLARLQAGQAYEAWSLRFQSAAGKPFFATVSVSTLPNAPARDGKLNLRWILRDITQRKQTEGWSGQCEQKLRGIFDHSLDGISLVDERGVFVEWNQSMEGITGLTRETVLGKFVADVIARLTLETSSGKQVDMQGHTYLANPLNWTGRIIEVEIQRPDRTRRIIQHSAFPIKTAEGLMGGNIVRDITERKQMEHALQRANDELEARVQERTTALTYAITELQNEIVRHQETENSLRDSESRQAVILNSVPVVLYTFRVIEAIPMTTWVSPNVEQITGFSPNRFIDTPDFWQSRLHPDDRAQVLDQLREAAGTASGSVEYRWQRADGSYCWFLDRFQVTPRGEHAERVGTWLDITKRKHAEQAEHAQRVLAEVLRDTAESFNNMLDADQVLKCLLANVARIVPCDGANVMLVTNGVLRLVTWHGYVKFAKPDLGHSDNDWESRASFQQMFESGQPILISDTHGDAAWVKWTETPWIRSYIGAPIRALGKIIGFLNVDSATPDLLNTTHVERLKAITDQASVALSNVHLFTETRQKAERLRVLSQCLVEAQEIERARIARELHDEIGQILTGLMVDLHYIERHAQEPTLILARATDAKQLTNKALESLHQLVVDLRPTSLEHQGLATALRQYIDHFSQQYEMPVEFDEIGLGDVRLSDEVEIALYRIVQEALTNVARHARARAAEVLLTQREGWLRVLIWDDGIGFDAGATVLKNRMGLAGMRERAEMLGGRFHVESKVGFGTTVRVEVPHVHSNFNC